MRSEYFLTNSPQATVALIMRWRFGAKPFNLQIGI